MMATNKLGVLPLPGGERVGVRGQVTLDKPLPPHPARFARRPLPTGERWSKWVCLRSHREEQRMEQATNSARSLSPAGRGLG